MPDTAHLLQSPFRPSDCLSNICNLNTYLAYCMRAPLCVCVCVCTDKQVVMINAKQFARQSRVESRQRCMSFPARFLFTFAIFDSMPFPLQRCPLIPLICSG